MPLTEATRNTLLDALAGLMAFASLHSADPGATGTSELAGGTPVYARKAITWNPASSGQITSSNTPIFDVPAGATVSWVGFWSAVSGGTFRGAGDVVDESYAGQGTYTITAAAVAMT